MKNNWYSYEPGKQVKFHFDNVYFQDPKRYGDILLYQVGDLSCAGGYEIGEHLQQCYEISYIASGKGVFTCDGVPYAVQEGDLVLNLPGQMHNGIADQQEPFRYFYVGFAFQERTGQGHEGRDAFLHIRKMFDQVETPVIANQKGIATPFTNLFHELINLKNYSPLMIETYLQQLIVMAYRSFYDRWVLYYAPISKSDETKNIIYGVINYIDVHLLELTELSAIAAELNYSYTYLSHIFSRETGLTIKEYYNRKRFEKASEWLKLSQWSVTQIAEKLHYQSIHSFSKAFRNYYGISPTEYQTLAANLKK
ncbi:AraC family transcriptional regulator [Paenibacillaceae bacterium]|nr:AraC family transcriptional regulator [Paenibacillaceae bacterium]